jgi:chromosome segregation ATPase
MCDMRLLHAMELPAMAAPDDALAVQLHARCHAAESRSRVLERQLLAAVELIDTLELQHGGRASGSDETAAAEGGVSLRRKLGRLADAAQGAPSAEQLRLCTQLAAAQAESQRLSRELGAVTERERAAREASEREQRRSSAVLKSSLESAAHARSTMELQQGVVEQARSAHTEELQRMEERLAASEVLRAKAEAEIGAKEQNVRRLMDLVQQHERRRADEREASEKADVERLEMQRALGEMADQLDALKARAEAAAAAKAAEAAKLAKAALPPRGGPKRAVLARRQQRAARALQPNRSSQKSGS